MTTSRFATDVQKAASTTRTAVIAIIVNCDKLIDMSIEHGVGMKRNPIEVLSVDAFADMEPEA